MRRALLKRSTRMSWRWTYERMAWMLLAPLTATLGVAVLRQHLNAVSARWSDPQATGRRAAAPVNDNRHSAPGAAAPAPAKGRAGSEPRAESSETRAGSAPEAWHGTPCRGHTASDTNTRERERYLARFVRPLEAGVTGSASAWVYVHPDVRHEFVARVILMLPFVAEAVESNLGLRAEPARVFVYPSVKALRAHGCSDSVTGAFYDGAIHLPAPSLGEDATLAQRESEARDLTQALSHEYVHHVLMQNGIVRPFWLQEGVAMRIAHDVSRDDDYALVRRHPLPPKQLVDGPPPGASAGAVRAFYAHAYVMSEFLEQLCRTRSPCDWAELTQPLARRRVTPEIAFFWATYRRGSDVLSTATRTLWDDYARHGAFAPATYWALLERRPPPVMK
jgi:hypothetical protein